MLMVLTAPLTPQTVQVVALPKECCSSVRSRQWGQASVWVSVASGPLTV